LKKERSIEARKRSYIVREKRRISVKENVNASTPLFIKQS
jgi:hypothetical protein